MQTKDKIWLKMLLEQSKYFTNIILFYFLFTSYEDLDIKITATENVSSTSLQNIFTSHFKAQLSFLQIKYKFEIRAKFPTIIKLLHTSLNTMWIESFHCFILYSICH